MNGMPYHVRDERQPVCTKCGKPMIDWKAYDDCIWKINGDELMLKPSVVKSILKSAPNFEWELWKTGMMRLDLDETNVLHIWDRRYHQPHVTMIHDHPFDLKSTVIAGRIINSRYVMVPEGTNPSKAFWKSRIQCGAEACVVSEPIKIHLQLKQPETFSVGETYRQLYDEIHATLVQGTEGAVTLVNRIFGRVERHYAHVFVEDGQEWGDAAPRPATVEEVIDISQRALTLF